MSSDKNSLLIAIDTGRISDWPTKTSILELEKLAQTAGLTVVEKVIQNLDRPNIKHYLGSGKIEELLAIIEKKNIQVCISDDELTPSQHKNLEKLLQIKIMDRTSLILDIFATRAQTFEAHLQVELAQLEYLKSRLSRLWLHLSRLAGGIGTKGPGETQLESDKRQIETRIGTIKQKLKKIKQNREIARKKRQKTPFLTGTLIGYTNAGKSTLINLISKSNVLVEDKLFATLDPTTRKIKLPTIKEEIMITDTVGFIQKLPHQLVSSFQATLEETQYSNFILHIIDVSNKNFLSMINTVNKLLSELNSDNIPIIYVFNKIDKIKNISKLKQKLKEFSPHVFMSAKTTTNLEDLFKAIESKILESHKLFIFSVPEHRMDIIHLLHKHGTILSKEYENNKFVINVNLNVITGNKIMTQLNKS